MHAIWAWLVAHSNPLEWPEYAMRWLTQALKGRHEIREAKAKADLAELTLEAKARETEINRLYQEIDKSLFRGAGLVIPESPPKAADGENQELVDEAWRRWQRDHPINS